MTHSFLSILFRKKLKNVVGFLAVIFLLYFPKGGVKILGTPITWGYGFLFLIALLICGKWFFFPHRCMIFRRKFITAFSIWLPFQCIAILGGFLNGVEGGNIGFYISFIVSFFFLPLFFYLLLPGYLESIHFNKLINLIRVGVFFISVYGIFLFFYKIMTGSFLEIPFLTVNYDDVGLIEEKHIDRGGYFKLISTYNNGNIFGICLLMLLPLYDFLEKRKLHFCLVRIALLLTLSRTVWAALLLYEICAKVYLRGVQLKTVLYVLFGTLFAIGGIAVIMPLLGFKIGFLLDLTLGGRVDMILESFSQISLLPSQPFFALSETVYNSILQIFGVIGLICFLFAMIWPSVSHLLLNFLTPQSLYKKSLFLGCFNYLFIALIDGAILYIPVMVFFLFINFLLLSKDYDTRSVY